MRKPALGRVYVSPPWLAAIVVFFLAGCDEFVAIAERFGDAG